MILSSFFRRSIRICTLVGLCLLTAATSAQTQQILRLRLEPLSIRGRSGSPIPLQIKLEYNSPQLLEGDLLLQVYNSYPMPDDLIATIRYEGLVLQGNDYIFNTVLPPFEHSHNKLYQIVGWFDTADGRMSLSRDVDDPEEPHELLSIGAYERATLVASVSGSRDFMTSRGNRAFLNNALSLENYNPDQTKRNNNQRRRAEDNQRIQNYTCSWDALSLPEDPLHLCSFDVVLLADGALGRLTDPQLKALKTWVDAGGSLCVLPDGRRLEGPHIQFLQTLFEDPEDPGFRLSAAKDGSLLVISDDEDPVVNRHVGLGRVTLLPAVKDLAARLSPRELGEVVGHLWKVRSNSPVYRGDNWNTAELIQTLRRKGHKVTKADEGYYVDFNGRREQRQGPFQSLDMLAIQSNLQSELQPKVSPLASACETALMPEGVEMVPASVVAMLLIAYVLTIGPIDYFVLGYFRARKYTWVAFPVVTIIFTAITVNIAHRYMASSDTGGRMSIVDLVDAGRPVRQTDLQMHFYGSQTTLEEETSNSFLVPGQMIHTSDPYQRQQAPRSINRTISYAGRFPQAFSTEQDMRQWEPQINRRMTFTVEQTQIPQIDWDNSSLLTTADGRRQLSDKLQRLSTPDRKLDGIVLHRDQRFALNLGSGFMFSDRVMTESDRWQEQNRMYAGPGYYSPPKNAIASMGVIKSSTINDTRDYFSIVSQVSPQGSASLEDLPLLDPTDDGQWLLIVAVKEGMNTTVFRRLHENPTNEISGSPGPLTPEKNDE